MNEDAPQGNSAGGVATVEAPAQNQDLANRQIEGQGNVLDQTSSVVAGAEQTQGPLPVAGTGLPQEGSSANPPGAFNAFANPDTTAVAGAMHQEMIDAKKETKMPEAKKGGLFGALSKLNPFQVKYENPNSVKEGKMPEAKIESKGNGLTPEAPEVTPLPQGANQALAGGETPSVPLVSAEAKANELTASKTLGSTETSNDAQPGQGQPNNALSGAVDQMHQTSEQAWNSPAAANANANPQVENQDLANRQIEGQGDIIDQANAVVAGSENTESQIQSDTSSTGTNSTEVNPPVQNQDLANRQIEGQGSVLDQANAVVAATENANGMPDANTASTGSSAMQGVDAHPDMVDYDKGVAATSAVVDSENEKKNQVESEHPDLLAVETPSSAQNTSLTNDLESAGEHPDQLSVEQGATSTLPSTESTTTSVGTSTSQPPISSGNLPIEASAPIKAEAPSNQWDASNLQNTQTQPSTENVSSPTVTAETIASTLSPTNPPTEIPVSPTNPSEIPTTEPVVTATQTTLNQDMENAGEHPAQLNTDQGVGSTFPSVEPQSTTVETSASQAPFSSGNVQPETSSMTEATPSGPVAVSTPGETGALQQPSTEKPAPPAIESSAVQPTTNIVGINSGVSTEAVQTPEQIAAAQSGVPLGLVGNETQDQSTAAIQQTPDNVSAIRPGVQIEPNGSSANGQQVVNSQNPQSQAA